MGLALKLIGSAAIVVVVLGVGIRALRMIARPAPPPPPPGELRKVNVRYRCTVCGMEMKMLLAPDETPDPPHHCMEEMEVTVSPYG